MSNYKTPATGRLWPPGNELGEIEVDRAIEQLESIDGDGPVVSSDDSRVLVDELMFNDGSLQLRILFGEWYASVDAPLRPNGDLQELIREITTAFDVTSRESGYYLSNGDVAFVDTFTPDSQGRITVGRDYSNKNLKVIGVVEDG